MVIYNPRFLQRSSRVTLGITRLGFLLNLRVI
ncbi:hypothetical protein Vi05172_g12950 [Venturia inaequalis]|nr:hypothetical protein Vi05172_g12950 [Venturia inaequalis]